MPFNLNSSATLPIVALRGLVVFPDLKIHFDIGRKKSVNAVEAAARESNYIFLVAQKNLNVEIPEPDDLCPVGVIAKINQIVKAPGKENLIHISVTGIKRAVVTEFLPNKTYLRGIVTPVDTPKIETENIPYSRALVRQVKDAFSEYVEVAPPLAPQLGTRVLSIKDPGELADFIGGNIVLEYEDRQEILNIIDPLERIAAVLEMLYDESDLLSLESEIAAKVQERVDKNQKDYYLHEQLKVISEELNGFDDVSEVEELRDKVTKLCAPEEIKEKLLKECSRFSKYNASSPEAAVSRNYLETCVELPWGIYSKENNDLAKSRKILENDHYGLEKVKERILEYLAVATIAPGIKGQIICLVGPPGVGKTSIARSIARATGRKYQRISLGGIKDEAEIRGHRKTYIGSMPGRISDALIKAKVSNPLILLDEIDKLSSDYKGDPTSALLEVLDPEQNFSFTDHYIDLPYDLSKVMFITTANDRSQIPEPLQDRMEIIELGSYTYEEKLQIAKKHLVPKQLKANGLRSTDLRITDKALGVIIDEYTKEAGVRALEQKLASVCRKCAAKKVNGLDEKITIRPVDVEEYLGTPKFKKDNIVKESEVGVANGLAWTSVGGEMLEVEIAVMDGTGKIELTGSLGQVMQESAKAAVSYVRSKAADLGISSTFYKDKDIHIHFPEGAVPKDGPSAGVTISTALVSTLTGLKIRKDVAMTGEISLRGRILPIGGLKEKSMAAYRNGIKTVIIPNDNIPDLDEVDKKVRDSVEFIPVKHAESAWKIAIENYTEKSDSIPVVTEQERSRIGITN